MRKNEFSNRKKSAFRLPVIAVAMCLGLIFAMAFAGCGGTGGDQEDSSATSDESAYSDGGDSGDSGDSVPDGSVIDSNEEGNMADNQDNQAASGENGRPRVEITMEDGGKILLELDPTQAPKTVENFLKLVNENFYDGLTFHRIIPGFMIQGGDPDGTGMGGAPDNVLGEFSSNNVKNELSHVRGVISMARANDPNSASSQFFITNADATFLDGNYAAFGHVVSGMDEVDKISAVKTKEGDYPVKPVVISTMRQIA